MSGIKTALLLVRYVCSFRGECQLVQITRLICHTVYTYTCGQFVSSACSKMLVQVNHPSCTVESSAFPCLNHRNLLSVLGVDCSLFRDMYCKYHFTTDFPFVYRCLIGRRFQYQDGQSSFLRSVHVCFL